MVLPVTPARKSSSKINLEISQLSKIDDFLAKRPRFKSFSASNRSISSHSSTSNLSSSRISFNDNNLMRIMLMSMRPQSATQTSLIYTSKNWENLGKITPLTQQCQSIIANENQPFVSDASNTILHLDAVHMKANHRIDINRIVLETVFVSHIKSLLIGIESDSFAYDIDHGIFQMEPNVTIKDVRASTMEHSLREFIECGSCYKRLKLLVNRDYDRTMVTEHSYMFSVRFHLLLHQLVNIFNNFAFFIIYRSCATHSISI